MKKYTPLDGLRWSRNSDSALNNMPQTDVLGRAGGEIRTSVIFLDAFIYGYVQNYTAYCPKKCCIGGGGEMPVGDMN